MSLELPDNPDPKAIAAADDAFYQRHPEMIDPTGHRIPVDAADPQVQPALKKEWMADYVSAGGKTAAQSPGRKIKSPKDDCPHAKGVDIRYEYADREGVAGAQYTVMTPDRTVLDEGYLDEKGEAHVEGLPADQEEVLFSFHDDPYRGEIFEEYKPKPHGFEKPPPDFIDKAIAQWREGEAKYEKRDWRLIALGVWFPFIPAGQAALVAGVGRETREWIWGSIQGDFNQDPSVGQIVFNTAITLIPVVDQVGDVRDLTANLKLLVWDEKFDDPWVWTALVLTLLGCFPEIGTAIKGVGKVVLKKGGELLKLPELLRYLNAMAKVNGPKWIRELIDNLAKHGSEVKKQLKQILQAIQEKLGKVKDWVTEAARKRIEQLQRAIEKAIARIDDKVNEVDEVIDRFKKRLEAIWKRKQPVEEKAHTRPAHSPGEPAKIRQFAETGFDEMHVHKLKDYAKDKRRVIIVRTSNDSSLDFHGDPSRHKPKPVEVKLKTAKVGPNAGLVELPSWPEPKTWKEAEEKGWKRGDWDNWQELKNKGYVGGDPLGRISDKEGKNVFGDYDLQGVYDAPEGGKYLQVPTNDPATLEEINNTVCPEQHMFQHGANDNFKKAKDGKTVMGRQPGLDEKFLVIDENGQEFVTDLPGLKNYYQETLHVKWPYDVP